MPGLGSPSVLLRSVSSPGLTGMKNASNSPQNRPEPMDDGSESYGAGGARDSASTTESGSDAGIGGSTVAIALGGGVGEGAERATREERAAKALQTAARVMLARKERFQKLAKETSALLVIQKRSREWLRQKQSAECSAAGVGGAGCRSFSQGL